MRRDELVVLSGEDRLRVVHHRALDAGDIGDQRAGTQCSLVCAQPFQQSRGVQAEDHKVRIPDQLIGVFRAAGDDALFFGVIQCAGVDVQRVHRVAQRRQPPRVAAADQPQPHDQKMCVSIHESTSARPPMRRRSSKKSG